MSVVGLYVTIVLIWGTTWAAITFQYGPVPDEMSVAYRFFLASALLFVYAAITRRRLSIPMQQYGWVVLMGMLMFSANYLLTYYAIHYVTSGLVAVIFSLMVIFNAGFERLFFARPIDRSMVTASALGLAGIVLLFWPEIETLNLADKVLYGVLLTLAGVVFASLGNMAAIINTRDSMPVVAVNAHGMFWGAAMSLLVGLLQGLPVVFDFRPSYLWSLLYLSVFGTAVAFGIYLALLRIIGSTRTAYTTVLFPVVALLISTAIEDYRWTTSAVAGVVLILAGNWLALRTRNQVTNKGSKQ